VHAGAEQHVHHELGDRRTRVTTAPHDGRRGVPSRRSRSRPG
jgi:hypothetical protein